MEETKKEERPRVEWDKDVQIVEREFERSDGVKVKLQARLSRLPLSRPRYKVIDGNLDDKGVFHPGFMLPIRIEHGEVCAPSIAATVASMIGELEAWAVQDTIAREEDFQKKRQSGHKPDGKRGIGGEGKTARDKAKHKDPALKTNNPTLSQKRGVGK